MKRCWWVCLIMKKCRMTFDYAVEAIKSKMEQGRSVEDSISHLLGTGVPKFTIKS
ncbi:hypothetical protein HanPSC8_Chr02g0064211 [Helianthus annuus]|nr:hypothetical protein HanPSC8_Chr02g0064211 [Helianthus annuus]